MIVTIESKARPCPGVENAISLAEEALRRENIVYSAGQLIHNSREIQRLKDIGLHQISKTSLNNPSKLEKFRDCYFLIRTHGESENLRNRVHEIGMNIIDATCPIVVHSQELVDQHIRDGWGIIIAGKKDHPEVQGLLERTNGNGIVVSSRREAKSLDFENRSLLIAQTTIDPEIYSEIRQTLSSRLIDLKIVDTTCRFIRNRQRDIEEFAARQDVVIIVGGKNSSNCRLLYDTSLKVNSRTYWVESPHEIEKSWFKGIERVGITGGASTPRWQLTEIKSYLENHHNPKGSKNRKGGKFLWWMRKRPKKEKKQEG